MFKLVTKMGQFRLGFIPSISSSSQVLQSLKIPASTSLQGLKDLSLISVPFAALCNVLNWPVSLRCQLACHYNVWNWSFVFTYQWDVAKTSKVGPSHWRPSCNVMMTSQHGPQRTNWWYLIETSLRRRMLAGLLVGFTKFLNLIPSSIWKVISPTWESVFLFIWKILIFLWKRIYQLKNFEMNFKGCDIGCLLL